MNDDVDQAIAAPVPNEVPNVSESDSTPLAYPDLLNVQSSLTSSTPPMQDIDRQPVMRVGLTQPSNGTQQLSVNRPNVVHDHQSSAASSAINSNHQRPSRAVGPSVSSGAIPKIGMNRQRPGGPPDVSVVNPSTSREVAGNNDGAFSSPGNARSSVTVEPYVVRNSRSPESDRVDRIEQEIISLQTSRTSFERRVCQTIETIPNQMAAIVSSVQRLQSNIESMVATVNERMNQIESRLNNLTISTESSNGSDGASNSGRITVMDPSVALIREELRNFTRNQRRVRLTNCKYTNCFDELCRTWPLKELGT